MDDIWCFGVSFFLRLGVFGASSFVRGDGCCASRSLTLRPRSTRSGGLTPPSACSDIDAESSSSSAHCRAAESARRCEPWHLNSVSLALLYVRGGFDISENARTWQSGLAAFLLRQLERLWVCRVARMRPVVCLRGQLLRASQWTAPFSRSGAERCLPRPAWSHTRGFDAS